MGWNLEEALEYYRSKGAPSDQAMLISLLKEIQEENNGWISRSMIAQAASGYGISENLLLALVKRIPRLRLKDTHCLEICSGKACFARADLSSFIEKTYGKNPEKFELRFTGCMRMCGKGPNIRWDGVLYNNADEKLIQKLVDQKN